MRVFIFILLTLQLLFASFIGVSNLETQLMNDLLYKDKTGLVMIFDYQSHTQSEHEKLFRTVLENNNVTLSKYTYVSSDQLDIFTTDISMNNQVRLKKGIYPKPGSRQYISTDTSIIDSNLVGTMKQIESDLTISIYDYSQLENYTPNGVYYVSTTDTKKLDTLINELGSIGVSAITDETHLLPTSINMIAFNTPIEFCMLLCGILLIIQFMITKLKKIFILKVYGYDHFKILMNIFYELIIPFTFAFFTSFFLLTCYYLIFNQADYFSNIALFFIKLFLMITVMYLILTTFCLVIYLRQSKFNTLLKGNKPFYRTIMLLNSTLKISFIYLLAISTSDILIASNHLKQQQNTYANWEAAENIYKIHVKYTGLESGRNQAEIDLYTNGTNFLDKLITENQGFLIDSSLFALSSDGYIYEEYGFPTTPMEVASHGRRLTVSESYFDHNPILTIDGLDIREVLSREPNTKNILVPQQFNHLEVDIIRDYMEEFYYEKVELDNMYREFVNQSPSTIKKSDLHINIIYTMENQTYFTYDPFSEVRNNNRVLDPIVVIYNSDNLHVSNSYSQLTRNVYYKSYSKDVYSELLPIGIETNFKHFGDLSAVYDELGHNIQAIERRQQQLIIYSFVLLFANFIITYHFIASYYEKNKFKLYLSRVFGYSWLQTNKYILFLIIALNIIPTLSLRILFDYELPLYFIEVILTLDIIIMIISSCLLSKSGFSKILKGEG